MARSVFVRCAIIFHPRDPRHLSFNFFVPTANSDWTSFFTKISTLEKQQLFGTYWYPRLNCSKWPLERRTTVGQHSPVSIEQKLRGTASEGANTSEEANMKPIETNFSLNSFHRKSLYWRWIPNRLNSNMSLFAARRATTQVASRSLSRRMSTAPRLHKAKDEWAKFVSKRPAEDVSAPSLFFPAKLPSERLSTLSSCIFTNSISILCVSAWCFNFLAWKF